MKVAFDKTAYDNEYVKQHYDKVSFTVPKGKRDALKALAKQEGLSVNDLLKMAVFKAYGVKLF